MKIELCPFGVDKNISLKDYLNRYLNISNQKIKSILNSRLRQKNVDSVLDLDINLVNQFMVNPKYNGPLINYTEDEKFIYIEKPESLYCQPLNYDESDNILSFLRSINKGQYLLGHHKSWEKGLLNRLDFVTSGILIYAKDYRSHQFIRENFSSIVKSKFYLCLVEGNWDLNDLSMTKYLKSAGERSAKVIVQEEGLMAKMDVKFLCHKDKKSMLLVKLKTGLRHQIRCLLADAGYPIIGDVLYGASQSNRVYLHAYSYDLNLTGKSFGAKSQKILLKNELFRSFLDLYGGFYMVDQHLLTF